MGRKKPYTNDGLRRVICQCCEKQKSTFQWTACALGNKYIPVCIDCDKHLNMLILVALGTENAYKLLRRYATRVETIYGGNKQSKKLVHKRLSSKSDNLDYAGVGKASGQAAGCTTSRDSDGPIESGVNHDAYSSS